MNLEQIDSLVESRRSLLCIGLDPDLHKLPAHIKKDPQGVLEFCKSIIDATSQDCIAYKPNLAFFESLGADGFSILKEISSYIPKGIFTIADAKRGDIGNTSTQYAKSIFEYLDFDAITVAPYMGKDSVTPFLEYKGKWVIVLGLTSNPGSQDFQRLTMNNGKVLYQEVITKCAAWGTEDNLMFVIGATNSQDFVDVRNIIPDHYLLVPGVGAQGGEIHEVVKNGKGKSNHRLIINASRSIIFADNSPDFSIHAHREAINMNDQIKYIFN
jgi:orotidine-5'-phosphate decarboxylase